MDDNTRTSSHQSRPYTRFFFSTPPEINFDTNEETLAILAFNDACARAGSGMFLYLAELHQKLSSPKEKILQFKSVVPRVLYVQCSWDPQESVAYLKKCQAEQWKDIQSKITDLDTMDIVAINLVLKTKEIRSVSWPIRSLTELVIYGTGASWYKLSSIKDWTKKATLNESGELHLINFLQPTNQHSQPHSTKKNVFDNSVQKLGRACDINGILDQLRNFLCPPSSGSKPLTSSEQIIQCTPGSEVMKALAAEEQEADKQAEVFRKQEEAKAAAEAQRLKQIQKSLDQQEAKRQKAYQQKLEFQRQEHEKKQRELEHERAMKEKERKALQQIYARKLEVQRQEREKKQREFEQEREIKEKEREAKRQEREAKQREHEAKKQEREAKLQERVQKSLRLAEEARRREQHQAEWREEESQRQERVRESLRLAEQARRRERLDKRQAYEIKLQEYEIRLGEHEARERERQAKWLEYQAQQQEHRAKTQEDQAKWEEYEAQLQEHEAQQQEYEDAAKAYPYGLGAKSSQESGRTAYHHSTAMRQQHENSRPPLNKKDGKQKGKAREVIVID